MAMLTTDRATYNDAPPHALRIYSPALTASRPLDLISDRPGGRLMCSPYFYWLHRHLVSSRLL
jgi:hypothetical protein